MAPSSPQGATDRLRRLSLSPFTSTPVPAEVTSNFRQAPDLRRDDTVVAVMESPLSELMAKIDALTSQMAEMQSQNSRLNQVLL